MIERPRVAAGASDADPWQPTRVHRWLLAAIVALATFRFRMRTGGIIDGEVDPSWWIGLGWMRGEGFDFGSDALFPYGPLGLLAEPSWASSRFWIALALLTSAAVAGWFGWVVVRAVRLNDNKGWAVAAALALGLLAGWSLQLPELAAVAMAVDVYSRLPSNTDRLPGRALVTGYGALVGVLALGKISTAVIAGVAVAVVAVASARGVERVVRLGIAGVSSLASLVVVWLLTGNELGGLPPWVRGSFEIVSGYGTAMATNSLSHRWNDRILVLVGLLALLLVVAQVLRGRQVGWRTQLPEAVLVALVTWFAFKAGIVRYDPAHINLTLTTMAIWIVLAGLALRPPVLPVLALLLAGLGLTASAATGDFTEAEVVVRERRHQPEQVMEALRGLTSSSAHAREVEDAKADQRDFYEEMSGLHAPMVELLVGKRVYADGWDIAALWAHDLDWQTLPLLQGYVGYTEWLDERNAAMVRDDARGPTAVLRRDQSFDYRFAPWGTPATQLAMTCSFETEATDGRWSVLYRAPDICGEREQISEVHVAPGEEIVVPEAGPDELVFATFEVDPSPQRRALDLLARDPNQPVVEVDGTRWKFVPGTGASPHLVTRPDLVGDRDLPGSEVDVDTIRFENLGGPVEVTFYRVPLG